MPELCGIVSHLSFIEKETWAAGGQSFKTNVHIYPKLDYVKTK